MSAADLMRQSRDDLARHLDGHHDELRAALESQIDGLQRLFSDNASDAIEAIGVHGERVGQHVAASLRSFDETLVAHGGELAQQIASHSDRFTGAVDEKLGAVESAFTIHGTAFTEKLAARANETAETMERHIGEFERRATNSATFATQALEDLVGRLETGLETRANGLNESLARNALATAKALADGVAEINRGLGEGVRALNATLDPGAIDERLGARIAEINAALETRLRDLAQTLASRTQDLHDTLSGRAGDLHALFDTKGPALVDLLGAKHAEIAQAFDQSNQTLHATIEGGTARSIQSLLGANDMVKSDVAEVLERLARMNESLNMVVGGATRGLAELETNLTDRVQEIHGAMGSMSAQVTALNLTSNNTISGVERLNNQIEHHRATLSETIETLSQTQSQFDDSLERRRATLEKLVAGMSTKTEEFDAAANAFAHLVEETFGKIESRARDTGGFLVDSTREIAGLVERQFGEVRDAGGKERERTAAALRAAYDQASAEMNEIFGQAVEKFRASAADMRGMSTEIQRELDATREEVRRGALELPQETAQQAAAMRRVVAEQIKALNDLTDIVARSGRVYDLAEPVAAPAVARAEPPRQIATPAARPAMANAAQAEPAFRSRPSNGEYDEQPRARVPAAAPIARPAPPAPQASNARGPGWITDLLARASREEPEPPRAPSRPAARAPQSLDTISLDISRMVDAEAARDAWESYYRGETGAFTRDLYTPQGRATFEEIGRRYVNEPEFRESVDRYSQEFERILANVAREDRDGSRIRAYLASDSGKVYTLLAHAAGRLD